MSDWKTALETPQSTDPMHTVEESQRYSPRRRPCYPKIIIIDDDSDDQGETIRLRKDGLTIGRIGCDLSFPAEALMSSSHARISLQEQGANHWVWMLEDLDSRHGLFARLKEFPLLPGVEFLAGGSKLCLHGEFRVGAPNFAALPTIVPYLRDNASIEKNSALELCSYTMEHMTALFPLRMKSMELGRMADGAIRIASDPFLEPIHAMVTRGEGGQWKISDRNSLNGLWLRVRRMILTSTVSFMVGEQRFRFELS